MCDFVYKEHCHMLVSFTEFMHENTLIRGTVIFEGVDRRKWRPCLQETMESLRQVIREVVLARDGGKI